MNPLPGLKPGVSGLWHTCHDLQPCQTCRKRPPLRSERMPFIPRLKSLGFSGMAYKEKSVESFFKICVIRERKVVFQSSHSFFSRQMIRGPINPPKPSITNAQPQLGTYPNRVNASAGLVRSNTYPKGMGEREPDQPSETIIEPHCRPFSSAISASSPGEVRPPSPDARG